MDGGVLACNPATSGCNKKLSQVADPWIAIFDWKNWHGISVDALIRTSMNPTIDTLLIALESHFPQYPDAITDGDLLIHFAKLVESIDNDDTPHPLVVNLSFGRLHEPGDALDATCNQMVCGPGALSCQIARLLKYLTRPDPDRPDTVVVAARGNDVLELGPGELKGVVSVGMTDLTEMADGGTVVDPWENPPNADALMPGGHFCLTLEKSPQHTPPDTLDSVLPTGSSFSAALFSAMLAEQLLDDPETVKAHLDNGPLWMPRSDCFDDGCPFLLHHDGTDFPILSGRGNARIMEIVTGDVSNCGTQAPEDLKANLLVVRGSGPYKHLTLPELTARTHRQTPETNGCVPCRGAGAVPQGAPLAGRSQPAPTDLKAIVDGLPHQAGLGPKGPKPSRAPTPFSLTIDMHTGWYLDHTQTLRELYLRVGQELRLVQLKEPALKRIADGYVGKLTLNGTFYALDLGAQPSLVFVISRWNPDTQREERFWKSTPVFFTPVP